MADFPDMQSPRSIAATELAWLHENVDHTDVAGRAALGSIAAQLAVADELAEVRAQLRALARNADKWSAEGLGVAKMPY
ncbi:hypothetical protein [Amycolatopsis sp. YIM 10]|uniref:hypothetical protein n=1 Tax=Amycolatopsis sp. YIM 10 TaxID=2653857 RepID=UPI0012908101|nr:hypothetical protein [Amycolatopsis sp. YIM 10]